MRILATCLMPNHVHLVLWPAADGDLSRWMQWLTTTHVRRYHEHYKSSGHVWQGRFKAFPIQEDDHLLTVLRYVERNPVRAGLCDRAADWPWSSARWRQGDPAGLPLAASPVPLPADWAKRVDKKHADAEYEALCGCITRSRPYGTPAWTAAAAKATGTLSSLRPRGRPRKATTSQSVFQD